MPTINHEISAAELQAQGIDLLERGENAAAVEALLRSAELAPDKASYWCNLAEAHRRVGNAAAGAECAQRATELDEGYANAWTNLGCCRFDAGDHAGALEAFNQAASLLPSDARAFANRADARRELGKVRAAIADYRKAIALDPQNAHAHGNLGLLLLAIGKADGALKHCERAVELAPGDAQVRTNLGRCLFGLDRMDDAMDVYADAYELNPDFPALCCNIGETWRESGDMQQAALWFEKALKLDPAHLESRVQVASLKTEIGWAADAVADLLTLVEEHPDNASARSALAHAQWDDGDAEGAIASYREAIALRPEFAALHASLGQVLASAGDVEAAKTSYLKALEINPNCIPALNGLATTKGAQLEDEHVARMNRLLGSPRIREGARGSLHNGLAHYFDGEGNYPQAAIHAAEANALQWSYKSKRGWNYEAEKHSQRVDQMIEFFSPDYFERIRGWGNPDERPVFVVGMPRSGTTLTEQILASHPQALGVGERSFVMRSFEVLQHKSADHSLTMPMVREIRRAAQWHLGQLEELAAKAGSAPLRIVDKMPDNYSMLGWIVTLFPNARIIHCRRDLRDVAVSCWMTSFGQIQWACHWEHMAARMRDYRRLMEHWRRVLPVPILESDYEALVADQEAGSRRLVSWTGLDWDDRCLEFHKGERLVRTASVTQVRQPVYTRSVERWRRYEKDLAPLFDAIEKLG